MKATLQFDLPEDSYEFKAACNAGQMLSALDSIRQLIRNHFKYGEADSAGERLNEIREIVYDALLGLEE